MRHSSSFRMRTKSTAYYNHYDYDTWNYDQLRHTFQLVRKHHQTTLQTFHHRWSGRPAVRAPEAVTTNRAENSADVDSRVLQ